MQESDDVTEFMNSCPDAVEAARVQAQLLLSPDASKLANTDLHMVGAVVSSQSYVLKGEAWIGHCHIVHGTGHHLTVLFTESHIKDVVDPPPQAIASGGWPGRRTGRESPGSQGWGP